MFIWRHNNAIEKTLKLLQFLSPFQKKGKMEMVFWQQNLRADLTISEIAELNLLRVSVCPFCSSGFFVPDFYFLFFLFVILIHPSNQVAKGCPTKISQLIGLHRANIFTFH
jgi:hypothetical protein